MWEGFFYFLLLEFLFNRKVEVCVWIRLILKGEVPPLIRIRLPAMFFHTSLQQKPKGMLILRNRRGVLNAGYFIKQIIGATHIQDLFRLQWDYGNVHRASPAVTGFYRNVSLGKQIFFVDVRIELGFHRVVVVIFWPAYKMIRSSLRSVGIINK